MEYKADEVKSRSRGCWGMILGELVSNQDLTEAMGRAKNIGGPCPICGGVDRFYYDDKHGNGDYFCRNSSCGPGDGWKLLMECNRWDFVAAINAVGELLHAPKYKETIARVKRNAIKRTVLTPSIKKDTDDKTKEKMRKAWQEALPLNSQFFTVFDRYKVSRGLSQFRETPSSLRLHPGLEYWHKENKESPAVLLGTFPTLLALVHRPDGSFSLHRTHFDAEGNKANVPSPRRNWGKMFPGSAIQLFQPDKELALTEGLETAIAVRLITGLPVWPCLNTSNLATVIVPDSVDTIHIFADLDLKNPKTNKRPGFEASIKLADRMTVEGRLTSIHIPPGPIQEGQKSIDWLDVWNARSNGDQWASDVIENLSTRFG